ncbi:MAG: hypothetical protein ACYCO0_04410 [Candidatus Micrarchaeaceae archaeon]
MLLIEMEFAKPATGKPATPKIGFMSALYASQMILLYQKKLESVDLANLDFKGVVALVQVRTDLAMLQSEVGMKKEAADTRLETLNILSSKADALEKSIFERCKSLGQDITEFRGLYRTSHSDDNRVAITVISKAKDLALKERAAALTKAKSDIDISCTEAVAYRNTQLSFMILFGDYDEAFNMAIRTAKKYHDAGLYKYGHAERLMINVISESERVSNLLYQSGVISGANRLRESALIGALEMADIENRLVERRRYPGAARYALEFEERAAELSASMGNYKEAHQQIQIIAGKYTKAGNIEYAISALEKGLNIARLESAEEMPESTIDN